MKKILITGANGFLGQHLCLFLQKASYEIIATGRGATRLPGEAPIEYVPAELTDKEAVQRLLAGCRPDVIIHSAALSKPDECENNRDFCLQTNVETTRHLLDGFKGHFIYISTDFVFGEDGPHAEDAETGPLNFYGASKLQAENIVKNSGVQSVIVRPVFIYGEVWQGMRPTFLHWVKTNLEQGKPLKIVGDQQRTPTYAKDICGGIAQIIAKEATGIFHLAGKDVLSPYAMAMKTAEVLNLDSSLVEEVTADTFPEPVKRAKKSGLKIEKAQAELGYEPVSFEEGVRLTFGL